MQYKYVKVILGLLVHLTLLQTIFRSVHPGKSFVLRIIIVDFVYTS